MTSLSEALTKPGILQAEVEARVRELLQAMVPAEVVHVKEYMKLPQDITTLTDMQAAFLRTDAHHGALPKPRGSSNYAMVPVLQQLSRPSLDRLCQTFKLDFGEGPAPDKKRLAAYLVAYIMKASFCLPFCPYVTSKAALILGRRKPCL